MKTKTSAHLPTAPHSRSAVVLLVVLLFCAEFLFITLRFQSKALLDVQDIAAWQRSLGHIGEVAKAAVLAVLLYVFMRKGAFFAALRRMAAGLSYQRLARILPVQLLVYAVFVYLSQRVFEATLATRTMHAWVALAWLVCGCAVVTLWLLCLAPAERFKAYLLRERGYVLLILPVTLITWFISLGSQGGWGILADWTFAVSAWLLSLFSDQLIYVNADTKVLGLGDFAVSIAPQCSGYEGIGLIVAFTALYLVMHRKELKFPHTLVLFPLGAACIWFLNCVRIAVLISMGYFWSPEVAVGGFHSQAGWITFILTSVALLWIVDNSQMLRKKSLALPARPGAQAASDGLALSTLVPLVVLLAATLLTSALTSVVDYFYPLRVALVALALYKVWPQLKLPAYRPRWDAAIAAVLVAVVWAWLLGTDSPHNALFQAHLDAMPTHWALLWLALRFVGAVATVPIAEELAFRCYLLCKLSGTAVQTSGALPVRLAGVVASSVAFGALHNAWLAGTFAGLVFAWVRLRSNHIGDAILAHAGTNAILFGMAAYFGYWNLL
ncbi:exosortase E/protease, VPEID-CTERM system [Rhodoferax lacus]|uniref:exosortase E/protease, VPEID-CTERM system n=1 Tax=Rhodoferax lacus TaxID=2184758 RepID=UPI00131464D5|nr:exosortase E/protease, VPEID-CTERM system [Rhodoferax lacus]